MGEETGTSTAIEDDSKKGNAFCRRFGINPNLVMLKITLFVFYGGN